MPLSAEHKQRSRDKILKSAFNLFALNGYDNTSIDQVMKNANMTRGAFYAHFTSKSDLYKRAMLDAAINSRLMQPKPETLDDGEWRDQLVKGYLSMEHVNFGTMPCPLAFLATDVAVREPEVRKTYTRIYKNMNRLIANYVQCDGNAREDKTLAATALLIGGVAVARALNDNGLKKKLLMACEASVQSLLDPD
jgi:AcrR family transcriptional regulator